MKVIYPPTSLDSKVLSKEEISIFLGGSIEMGTAEKWQDRVIGELTEFTDVTILNPRRNDWDKTWKNDPTPGTKFHDQVTWELTAQSISDMIIYHFDPKTKSPITLMELGAFGTAYPEKVMVSCGPDFWRYGNVQVFCDTFDIPVYKSLDNLLKELKSVLKG